MDKMLLNDWLTLAAIFIGPICAVFVTRLIDDRREKNLRRMEVFKTLMRTRRTPIYPEHVGALNLIEFEFANDKDVIKYWKELFKHLGDEHIRRAEETIDSNKPLIEQETRNTRFYERLLQERQKLLAKLLHAMAASLNFKIEQLEIFEGGYTPQGWGDIEVEQQAVRRLFAEIYLNKRILPIGVFDYTKMPEAPKIEKQED